MAFLDDMAAVVADLLLPDTQGGLGQTGIELVRRVVAPANPAEPWVRPDEAVTRETLTGAASGALDLADGVNILASDYVVTAAIPAMPHLLTDEGQLSVALDGREVAVVSATRIPPTGTPVAVRYILREA